MDELPKIPFDVDKQDELTHSYFGDQQPNASDEWHDEIVEICIKLSVSSAVFDVSTTYESAEKYLKKRKRWLYSAITEYLFERNETATFISNLDALRTYANYKQSLTSNDLSNITYGIIKLWDHSNLAVKQLETLRFNSDAFKNNFDKHIDSFKANFAHEMNKQFISLIAIFTALSFIAFGGITSFANILSGMSSIPIIELVILGSVWGLCMLNLVFAFMFFISKLTKLSIKTSERDGATLSEKYPFLVWGNYFLMLIFTVSCLMYFINYSNAHFRLVEFAQQHSQWVVFGGFLLIILIFGFFALCFLLPIRRSIKSWIKSWHQKRKEKKQKSTNNSQ